jgi:hypothetical protein
MNIWRFLLAAALPAVTIFGCDGGGDSDPDAGDCATLVYDGDYTVETPADLAPLDGYTDIGGTFYIQCPQCSAFDELRCLTMVYDEMVIMSNDAVTDLTGLERLRSTNEWFQITENASLESLAGLGGLQSVGGPFFVSANPALTSLDGLESLTSVSGIIQIFDNPNLGYCEICDLVDQVQGLYADTYAYGNKVDACWDSEVGQLFCY